jgi:hypothetical protein
MSDTFPGGDIIWDKVDQTGWEFRHQSAPAFRIDWSAVKTWKDIIPVTKQNLGTVDYSFNNIWGDKVYANLLVQAPTIVTNNLSLGLQGSDPSLTEGFLWYRSDLKRLRYYDGVFSRSLVHTDEFNYHASRHAAGGEDPITSPLPLSAIPPLFQPWKEIVTSSDVKYVDFTGLDVKSHKAYVLIGYIKNNSGSNTYYLWFVEGDYTNSNYNTQILNAAGTTIAASRATNSYIAYASSGANTMFYATIVRDPTGYARCCSFNVFNDASNVALNIFGICKNATVSNITQVRIDSYNNGAIGAGSRLMLFRMGG